MNEYLDIFFREELRIVNKHLPRERRSLCELLEMKVPYVVTYDGSIHVIDPRELEHLSRISSRDCSLNLPIIVEYIPEDQGIYVIRDPVAASIVAKIMGLPFSKPLFLHRSQVLDLRRILRTSSTILLSPGLSNI